MTIAGALSRPELRNGAQLGLLAVAGIGAAALLATAAGHRPRSWAAGGSASVGAALLALQQGVGTPGPVVLGLALLGMGGLLPRWRKLPAVVPGALVMATQVPAALPRWSAPLVAVVIVAVAVAGPEVEAGSRPWVGPAMMAGAALGAWACVPDVEQVAAVAAAFTVVAAGSVWPPLRLGRALVGPAAGLVLWAAAEGSRYRPASLIGAAAGLGLFVVLPLLRRRGAARGWDSAVVLVVGQMAFVTLTSRGPGLLTDARSAAVLSTVLLVAAAIVVLLLTTRSTAPAPHPGPAADVDWPR